MATVVTPKAPAKVPDPPKTQPPALRSATRQADGSVRLLWTNNVPTGLQTYSKMYLHMRKAGSGNFAQANSFGYPAIKDQVFVQYVKPGGGAITRNEEWEYALVAYGPAGTSAFSNTVSTPALATEAPQFESLKRTAATQAKIILAQQPVGAATITATYVMMRVVGTGTWRQVNRTTTGWQNEILITLGSGSDAYEFYLYSTGPGGNSKDSAVRSVEAWWEIPAGVSDLNIERNPDGKTSMAWRLNPGPRSPYLRIEIFRAEGNLGQFSLIQTLPGTAYSFIDTAARPEAGYRYEVVPVSHAGPAQRQGTSGPAVRDVPNAATSVTAELLAGDKARIRWTRNPTTDRPITGQALLARTYDSDTAWASVAALTATQTTTDYTIGANKRLEFAIATINTAGTTNSEASRPVGTTPSPPSSLTAAWLSPESRTIRLTWPRFASIAQDIHIEFTTNGTSWLPVTNPAAPLPISEPFWDQTNADVTVPHTYRLNVGDVTNPEAARSGWVVSNKVEPLTRPLQAAVLTPEQIDATGPITIRIVHNPIDNTKQTAAVIRHRKAGGAWTSITRTTDDFYVIPADTYVNGDTIEADAQTAGASGELSPVSEVLSFVARPAPTSTLTGPPATVVTKTAEVTWTAPTQVSAIIELRAGSTLVGRQVVANSPRTASFPDLEDRGVYTVSLTVRDNYQSAPVQTRTFTVELPRPNKPRLTVYTGPHTATATITTSGGIPATQIELWRSIDGGLTYEPVGALAGASGAITDMLATLGRTYQLRARAYSAAGGWIDSDIVNVRIDSNDVVVNWGENWENKATVVADLAFDATAQTDIAFVQFDRGAGRTAPVPYGGTSTSDAVSVSGVLGGDLGSTEREWVAASRQLVLWYRDPDGRSFPASLGGGVKFTQVREGTRTVAFTATETDHG